MNRLLIFALFLLAAPVTAEPIFPRIEAGQYTATVTAATVPLDGEGVPLDQPTASIGLMLEGNAQVACVNIDPGVSSFVAFLVPAASGRTSLRAYAFALPGCNDTEPSTRSEASLNTAFFYFGPIGRPDLTL